MASGVAGAEQCETCRTVGDLPGIETALPIIDGQVNSVVVGVRAGPDDVGKAIAVDIS